MRLTKYAEWIDQPCGNCRLLIDVGTIVDRDIDPDCRDHQKDTCLVCGVEVERVTKAHGNFTEGTHATRFAS